MFGALAIVAGIAIVDSLNPGTLAPAFILAVSAKPARRVLEFAIGFLVVQILGGALLVFGPGKLLFDLIPDPTHHVKDELAVVAGIALVAGAVALVIARKRLTRTKQEDAEEAETAHRRGGSALLLGGGIALAELPTAFPYFAAIAAIDAANIGAPAEFGLIVIFNLIFLSPLFLVAGLIAFVPSAWERFINPVRTWMTVHWPQVLAVILGAGGIALVVYGVDGLSS